MEEGKKIILDGKECYVLVDDIVKGDRYLYVAEIENEDTTGNFYLYKVTGEKQYQKVVDGLQLKAILPTIVSIMSNHM